MSKIVNLRTVRKQKARAERAAKADANRIAHGRTKAERKATQLEAERERKTLDGKHLAPEPDKSD